MYIVDQNKAVAFINNICGWHYFCPNCPCPAQNQKAHEPDLRSLRKSLKEYSICLIPSLAMLHPRLPGDDLRPNPGLFVLITGMASALKLGHAKDTGTT